MGPGPRCCATMWPMAVVVLEAVGSREQRAAARGGVLRVEGMRMGMDGNSVVGLVFGAWAWSPSPESSQFPSPPVVSLHLFTVRAHIHMPAVA